MRDKIQSNHLDLEELGGRGYTDFFLACVSSLKEEELIRRSPRGKRMKPLLEAILVTEQDKIASIAVPIVNMVHSCLVAGKKHKLPSASEASVWSTFHNLRQSHPLKLVWSTFVSNEIPEPHNGESEVALQLIVDRLLKKLIKNKADMVTVPESHSPRPLTSLECNAVRYMAGYVAITLLKRYRKPSKNQLLKEKRKLFVKVLSTMRAEDQPGEPQSPLEYSRLWSELIDRGGLYNIDDKVFSLMEAIEMVTRRCKES